jgi:hypothetical protein
MSTVVKPVRMDSWLFEAIKLDWGDEISCAETSKQAQDSRARRCTILAIVEHTVGELAQERFDFLDRNLNYFATCVFRESVRVEAGLRAVVGHVSLCPPRVIEFKSDRTV